MFSAHKQFWCTVPDRHDDLVSSKEWLERLIYKTRESEVTYFHDASTRDENVGWFQVTMQDVRGVQVYETVEELVYQ